MGGTQLCHEGLCHLTHVEHEQGGGHQQSREVAAKTGGTEEEAGSGHATLQYAWCYAHA